MTPKHLALALIPIIGASVLLWGQPYSSNNLLMTNAPSVNDLLYRGTNQYPLQWNRNSGRITIDNYPMVFHYTNHEVYIADHRYGPTNIVISNDYSGTIQIGTNFATLKELDTWMQVLGGITRTVAEWPSNRITNSEIASLTHYKRFTYTVDVADGLWFHTNVIDIHRCSEFCTRMRYVDDGLTNDFHAAFVGYTVKTNAP